MIASVPTVVGEAGTWGTQVTGRAKQCGSLQWVSLWLWPDKENLLVAQRTLIPTADMEGSIPQLKVSKERESSLKYMQSKGTVIPCLWMDDYYPNKLCKAKLKLLSILVKRKALFFYEKALRCAVI